MKRTLAKTLSGALLAGAALALAPLLGIPASAEGPQTPSVARLSALAGRVDVRRSDADETFAAAPNASLNAGDYLTTEHGSRAEVDFGYASVLREAPDTQLRFTQIDPQNHVAQLGAGTVELGMYRGVEAHPVLETPAVDIRPAVAGRYRVTVDGNGNTIVAVRSGHLDLALRDGFATDTLGPGDAVLITGSGGDAQFAPAAPLAYDGFDRWCDDRDDRWSRIQDWAYVDDGMIGVEDLSHYGQWASDATYGQVWVPTDEPAGWAPYQDARWVWGPYYGWTWVGDEPWGYAPYHYGRWFHTDDIGWAWYPGPAVVAQPYVYEPAAVAFFAVGNGLSLSVGFGDIGWVPLAPGEPYRPWWGGYQSNAYIVYDDVRRYCRNARVPGAVVALSREHWADGNFSRFERLRGEQLAHLGSFRGDVPIVPTARDLAYSGRDPRPVRGPSISNRFSRMRAATRALPSFRRQRSNIAAFALRQYPSLAPSIARQARTSARRMTARAPHSVWDRFNTAAAARYPSHGTQPSYAAATRRFARSHDDAARHTQAAPRTYAGPAHSFALGTRSSTDRSGNTFERTFSSPHTYAAAPHRFTASHAYTAAPHRFTESRTYATPRAYAATRDTRTRSGGGQKRGRR